MPSEVATLDPSTRTRDGVRVLVCDDSPVVRRLLRLLLEKQGYAVEAVESGEEAFSQALKHRFGLIVSDVQMGQLSGVQLCRLLRRDPATRETPVVLLTAADDPRSRFWGRHAGADAYIAKESMNQDLMPAVDRLVRAHQSDRPTTTHRLPARTIDPLARLSEVLDELLFEAVVASEVRGLLEFSEDRNKFGEQVLLRASELAGYAYLVVELKGPMGPSAHVHARDPWPAISDAAAMSRLGIQDLSPEDLRVVRDEGSAELPPGELPATGEMALFPLTIGDEELGAIAAFGGAKRLAKRDRATLGLIARELVVEVRSLFLFEQSLKLARTDGLTGLANRRTADERLRHETARAGRYRRPLTIVLIDVDHFKSVNDQYGHQMGDEVLTTIAARLEKSLRRIDLAARWGGEEFLVILPDTDAEGGRVVADRIAETLRSIPPFSGGPPQVTASLGVASFRAGDDPDSFVRRADEAMYRAKNGGRDRVESDQGSDAPPDA